MVSLLKFLLQVQIELSVVNIDIHLLQFYFISFAIAYSDLLIKLVKSNSNKTGTIQIFHPSFGWGTICGWPRWTDAEGDVVCRQLGFTGVKVTRKNAYYGRESGPMLLSYVHCTGSESYIWDCKHSGWNNPRGGCRHGDDAGVDCN